MRVSRLARPGAIVSQDSPVQQEAKRHEGEHKQKRGGFHAQDSQDPVLEEQPRVEKKRHSMNGTKNFDDHRVKEEVFQWNGDADQGYQGERFRQPHGVQKFQCSRQWFFIEI